MGTRLLRTLIGRHRLSDQLSACLFLLIDDVALTHYRWNQELLLSGPGYGFQSSKRGVFADMQGISECLECPSPEVDPCFCLNNMI